MKILYINTGITGHYMSYLKALVETDFYKSVIVMPQTCDEINLKQYVVKNKPFEKSGFRKYNNWILEIEAIARNEKPDIIHFLEIDFMHRYFGINLRKFRKYRTVATIHHVKNEKIDIISNRLLCKEFTTIVAHSLYLKKNLEKQRINNCVHIEYPQFNTMHFPKKEACHFFGLNDRTPVIACVGATRWNKGLDILLDSLREIKEIPFQLLIAGKESFFSDDYIFEKSNDYREKVVRYSKFMTNEETAKAFCSADIICLPYRKEFNGASGPLGEGVALNKCIVGPNYGNIGDTINNHDLGYTFEPEDSRNLAYVLKKALQKDFKPNSKYLEYQKSLDPHIFKARYHELYENIGKR